MTKRRLRKVPSGKYLILTHCFILYGAWLCFLSLNSLHRKYSAAVRQRKSQAKKKTLTRESIDISTAKSKKRSKIDQTSDVSKKKSDEEQINEIIDHKMTDFENKKYSIFPIVQPWAGTNMMTN